MSSADFAAGLARVAWRQWTGIGVTGRIAPATNPIDPEALIALTGRLGEQDVRLRDAAIDWCIAAGHLVNGARLAQVAREMGVDGSEDVLGFVATVRAAGGPRWAVSAAAPFAYSARGKVHLSSLEQDARWLLRLRASVGINARADILACLLTEDDPIPVFELVRRTRFTRTNIDKTLAQLALAGQVDLLSSRRRDRKAGLSRSSSFASWPRPATRPEDWTTMFAVALRAMDLLEATVGFPDAVFGIEARSFLDDVRGPLAAAHVPAPSPAMSGTGFVDAMRAWIGGLPEVLDRRSG
jgi:hypothetical protein